MKTNSIQFSKLYQLISFGLMVTALFLLPSSCNPEAAEDQEELAKAATASTDDDGGEETHQERYVYYLDGDMVEKGAFDPNDEKLHISLTGEADPLTEGGGLIKIWAFTTRENYIAWGDQYGMPVACRLDLEDHLLQYAETSGALEHFELTGEVLPEYEQYANEYIIQMDCSLDSGKERGSGILFKDFFGGSANYIFNFRTYLWGGWNNRVSRYFTFGLYNGLSVFDRAFFRRRMATIWNWGWTNWRFWGDLSFLNDRMSSAILI